MSKTYVAITTSFPALHSWPECPFEDVAYLKSTHRHIFHVTMKFKVFHNDRDIEFIRHKTLINNYIREQFYERNLNRTSCEMIAEELLEYFEADFVSVFEDNENGAEVHRA